MSMGSLHWTWDAMKISKSCFLHSMGLLWHLVRAPLHSTQSESILKTLENVEKKQNEISTWELTGTEDTGEFTEALSQIQTVLNNVLFKHKTENHELSRKYRIASDTFKQGVLREQLMSLAFRQKRLLNILQKQNALKLSFQTQRSRPTTQQISTQCPPVGENSPTTDYLSSVSTGPDGKTGLEAPSDCHGGASEETCSSQSTSSHGDENLLDSSDSTHITLDIESPAGPTSTKTSGHQPLLLSSSPRAASSEKEKQRSEVTGTTVAASCNPQTCFLKDCSTAQLQFLSNLTDDHQIIQMPQAMPTVVPISAGNIPPSSWSAYQPMSSVQTLSRITINSGKLNTEKRLPGTKKVYNQTGEDFQGSVSRQNVHVITKIQSNMSGTCSTEHRECGTAHCVPHVTSSGTAFTVDSHSKTKASANDCLSPHEESVGDSRQLVSLIQHGVIKPGHNVLQLTLKGFTHRASLEPDGSIIDTKGQHFLSPAQWIVSFLGPNIPVSSTFAWKKVKYRSKSLSAYSVSSEATALQQASGAGGTPAEEPRRQGPSPAI